MNLYSLQPFPYVQKLSEHYLAGESSRSYPLKASFFPKQNIFQSFLLTVFISSIFSICNSQSITPNNIIINQFANYRVQINDFTTPIASGSVVLINFPRQFSPFQFQINKPYSGGAATDFCPSGCGSVTVDCSGQTIILNGLYPVAGTPNFTYTIFDIRNPLYKIRTNNFNIEIRTADYVGNQYKRNVLGRDFLAQQFTSISATLNNPYLWQTSDVTFDVTVQPQMDYFRMTFPTIRWENQTIRSNPLTTSVSINSSSHPITYTRVGQMFTIQFPQVFSTQTVRFTLKSINTPSSMQRMGQIAFVGLNYANQIIRESTFYIPSQQLTYDYLRQLESLVSYDTANGLVAIRVKIKASRTATLDDMVVIRYPPQIAISTTEGDYLVTIASVQINASPTFPAANVLQITPFAGPLDQPEPLVTMTIPWPRTAITTSNFKIQLFRKVGLSLSKFQQADCCALWIKEKPTLTAVLTTTTQERLASNTQYSFDLTHAFTTLQTTDSIVIQFPSVYAMDSSQEATVCPTVVLSLPSNSDNLEIAVCELSQNILTVSNIFKASQPPVLLNIKVSITNPPVTPNENFQIWSQDNTGAKIQSNSQVSITITPASLTSVQITPTSLMTNAKANYVIRIQSIGAVFKNTVIQVTIPPQVRFIQYSNNCQVDGVQQFCTYDRVNSNVKVLIGTDLVSTTFQVTLINLVNPQTVAETADFKIEIYDTAGNVVESSQGLTQGLNVQMTEVDAFAYSRMWMDVTALDVKGNLKFLVVTNVNLVQGSTYQIDMILSPRSMFEYDSLVSVLTFEGSVLGILLSSHTASQTLISFVFTAGTSKRIWEWGLSEIFVFQDMFTVSITLLKRVSGVYEQSVSTGTAISLLAGLNSIVVQDYEVTQTGYVMNESPGSIILKINTISPNVSFSSILINIPLNYQSPSGSYQHTSPDSSTTVTFTIPDLLNPVQLTSEPFTFLIYDSLNEIVGVSQPSTQYFTPKCTFPCRTCKSPSQPSLCIDCYQISSNSVHIYLYLQMVYFRQTSTPYGICTDHCQSGQYLDTNQKKCLLCDTNCSSCVISVDGLSGDPLKCLTCRPLNYLHSDNRCYETCPDGFYANNLICSACMINCVKCTDLNTCSECFLPFVFYLGQCLTACPLKTVATLIPSTPRSQCLSCSANCLVCSGVGTCTLCDNDYFLYNFVCLSACPFTTTQLYPDMNNVCRPCECLTCASRSYNCMSCAEGLVYDSVKFKCLTRCEDGQFNSSDICQSCFSNCLICSGASICTICRQPYILYKLTPTTTQCLPQCPTNTIMTISTTLTPTHILECIACKIGCSKCVISPNFCTQCQPGLLFYNNLCVGSCPMGHNISNYCRKCVTQCQECDVASPRNCSQCTQGFYLFNQFCYANCPQGTFAETSIKKCLNCQPLCETCLNATHCTSCKSGYFLFPNNLCYDSCPTTPVFYYRYNSQCLTCQPQCNGCRSSPIQCQSCSSGYFYQNQDTYECTTTCAVNYFIQDSKCIKCRQPCALCDTTYNSCASCLSIVDTKYVHEGKCYEKCPNGYYSDTWSNSTITIENKCLPCPYPCQTCTKSQCLSCESFAFMYKETCVLECEQTVDMPYEKDSYCTNCLSIPFCTFCEPTEVNSLVCWSCTFPYVLFQGQCLNECPSNYVLTSETTRVCQQSEAYLAYKQQIYERNKPTVPFIFLIIFLTVSLIIYPLSKIVYPYTYYIGYEIFLINLIDCALVYNWLIWEHSKYEGEFFDGDEQLVPMYLIIAGLVVNLALLGWVGFGYVLKYVYLTDARYQEWKTEHKCNFISLIFILIILGPRSHKLYYSKLFGLPNFSFRIVSVSKFYLEDRINILACFGDVLLISAFIVIAYNIFIEYSVLYLTAIQIFCIKFLTWILLIFDSKKPDRGFFFGDQKVALEEIEKQEEENLTKLRRVDTDHLIKMIRQKSACLLNYNHQPFGQIQKAEFMSVYNPEDYEDVPAVHLKKIQRNIEKGKFRKGRKITIQQKLQRFADSIKPKPKIVNDGSYLKGMIYWKPPKKIKNTKQIRVEPMTQESMLKILENTEMKYKQELEEIENIIFDQKDEPMQHNFRTGQFFYKTHNRLNVDSYEHLEDSNHSIQEFEDLSSQVFKAKKEQIEYNDLMNLNYAKKKHLPVDDKKPNFDDNQMRILYHQPMKRRVSKLKR